MLRGFRYNRRTFGRANHLHRRGELPAVPASDLRDMFMHLGYHVFALSTQSPNVDAARPTLFATVGVLLTLTFALNLIAIVLRIRTRESKPIDEDTTSALPSAEDSSHPSETPKMEAEGLSVSSTARRRRSARSRCRSSRPRSPR